MQKIQLRHFIWLFLTALLPVHLMAQDWTVNNDNNSTYANNECCNYAANDCCTPNDCCSFDWCSGWTATFRAAWYTPSHKHFRKIYSRNLAEYQLELSKSICDSWDVWASVGHEFPLSIILLLLIWTNTPSTGNYLNLIK